MTKTLSPPQAKNPLGEVVKNTARERGVLLETAESIFRANAATYDSQRHFVTVRTQFTPDELRVFDCLGWDKKKISQEAGRVQQIAQWQAVAGTTGDRKAAAESFGAAQAIFDKEAPGIEAQITALREKLSALERRRDEAAEVCGKKSEAVSRLRKLIPEEVKEQHDYAVGQLGLIETQIMMRKERIAGIEKAATYDVRIMSHLEAALGMARNVAPKVENQDISIGRINVNEWKAFIERLQAEIPELREHIKLYETEFAEKKRAADTLLEVYTR